MEQYSRLLAEKTKSENWREMSGADAAKCSGVLPSCLSFCLASSGFQ